MKSNYDYEEKDDKIAISNIIGIILLILSLLAWIVSIIVPFIYSMQVKNLSRDPKNIKDNGCLLYSMKQDKYGSNTFYLNQQDSYTLTYITIKGSPFEKNFYQLRKNSNMTYDEFKKIHAKECIKVRYIHHDFLWMSRDYLYDLQ